jgi:hypothetical protein
MPKLYYQPPPQKRRALEPAGSSELAVPIILLVLGLIIFSIVAVKLAGAWSPAVMGIILLAAAIETALGIGAAYLTAMVMGTSFGELRTAVVKLAAIIIFCGALGMIIPFGWILVFFVYFGLLMWLFGLEVFEAGVFSVIFTGVRFLAAILLLQMLK